MPFTDGVYIMSRRIDYFPSHLKFDGDNILLSYHNEIFISIETTGTEFKYSVHFPSNLPSESKPFAEGPHHNFPEASETSFVVLILFNLSFWKFCPQFPCRHELTVHYVWRSNTAYRVCPSENVTRHHHHPTKRAAQRFEYKLTAHCSWQNCPFHKLSFLRTWKFCHIMSELLFRIKCFISYKHVLSRLLRLSFIMYKTKQSGDYFREAVWVSLLYTSSPKAISITKCIATHTGKKPKWLLISFIARHLRSMHLIPILDKRKRCSLSFAIDKHFHPTLYYGCNYSSCWD